MRMSELTHEFIIQGADSWLSGDLDSILHQFSNNTLGAKQSVKCDYVSIEGSEIRDV
jgi:hypothetical protein